MVTYQAKLPLVYTTLWILALDTWPFCPFAFGNVALLAPCILDIILDSSGGHYLSVSAGIAQGGAFLGSPVPSMLFAAELPDRDLHQKFRMAGSG